MASIFSEVTKSWKSLDYVCGWFFKFAEYSANSAAACAFVSTNSISQGEQVARLWPLLLARKLRISFAHTSFKWANLASHNAGVTVVIVGLAKTSGQGTLFVNGDAGETTKVVVENICPYLVPYQNIIISAESDTLADLTEITNGNKPADGGGLILNFNDAAVIRSANPDVGRRLVRRFVGAKDSIQGKLRYCLWITEDECQLANSVSEVGDRLDKVREFREKSPKPLTQKGVSTPHAFQQIRQDGEETPVVIPRHSSVARPYLPISLHGSGTIVADGAFAIFEDQLLNFSLISSRIHLTWIATVCGKIKTDYRYSSTLGWNTFPVPTLTSQNRADLAESASGILLTREAHWPSTIAELYDPGKMPDELRAAHDRNDETLERIYIGRRFKNDTERLETLFRMYTEITSGKANVSAKTTSESSNE